MAGNIAHEFKDCGSGWLLLGCYVFPELRAYSTRLSD
jgi:hypothetical protein